MAKLADDIVTKSANTNVFKYALNELMKYALGCCDSGDFILNLWM